MITETPFHKKRHRLQVVQTDRLSDTYPAASFDVVHSSQVFEHFPSKAYSAAVIAGLSVIVRDGGLVFVSLVTGKHRTAAEVADDDEDSTHINIWPMAFWVEMFAAMGFVNVSSDYQQRFDGEPMYQRYQWQQMVWRCGGECSAVICIRSILSGKGPAGAGPVVGYDLASCALSSASCSRSSINSSMSVIW